MNNNDVLRRLAFAFAMSYETVVQVYALTGYRMKVAVLVNMLKKDEDPDFFECSDTVLELFLDGLIVYRRGPREGAGPIKAAAPAKRERLSNNMILRKIKIALVLKDFDIVSILLAANFKVTKSEVNALFQRKEHRNYQECGNQLLRNFLVGLTEKLRKVSERKKK